MYKQLLSPEASGRLKTEHKKHRLVQSNIGALIKQTDLWGGGGGEHFL